MVWSFRTSTEGMKRKPGGGGGCQQIKLFFLVYTVLLPRLLLTIMVPSEGDAVALIP